MADASATVTAAVITLNEQGNIHDCLRELVWADELLVVDGFSSDDTAALARASGARVLQRTFDTFAQQRNYALKEAQGAWVFFIDADERVDASLAEEARQKVRELPLAQERMAGYWVPRRNIILGKWVRHAGWWPDYQLRLLRRDFVQYDESRDPHETVIVQGETAYLEHSLLHYNYTSVRQVFVKQHAYALREARNLHASGVRAAPHRYLTQPAREFIRRYITLQGFRDGGIGLFLALTMAWYRFQVYWALRRLS